MYIHRAIIKTILTAQAIRAAGMAMTQITRVADEVVNSPISMVLAITTTPMDQATTAEITTVIRLTLAVGTVAAPAGEDNLAAMAPPVVAVETTATTLTVRAIEATGTTMTRTTRLVAAMVEVGEVDNRVATARLEVVAEAEETTAMVLEVGTPEATMTMIRTIKAAADTVVGVADNLVDNLADVVGMAATTPTTNPAGAMAVPADVKAAVEAGTAPAEETTKTPAIRVATAPLLMVCTNFRSIHRPLSSQDLLPMHSVDHNAAIQAAKSHSGDAHDEELYNNALHAAKKQVNGPRCDYTRCFPHRGLFSREVEDPSMRTL